MPMKATGRKGWEGRQNAMTLKSGDLPVLTTLLLPTGDREVLRMEKMGYSTPFFWHF